jgi:hypothetical protein
MGLARPHMADHNERVHADFAQADLDVPEAAHRPVATAGAPRLPQELVKSNLGEVKELGQDSARLQTTKELDGVVDLVIDAEGESLRISAEVESCHRDGMRNFDVIVRFIELTPSLRARIAQVALTNRRSSTIESVGA